MSDYTITTNFGAKDSLPSGNAGKVIKGSEFTTEFTNIQTAIATKADTAGDTFTGVVNFSADVAVNTNTLFVDVSEAKVGIGTTSPAYPLDVTGSAQLSGGDLILRSDSTDADTQSIRFENASSDDRSAYIRADYSTNSSGNATSLVFGTNPSTGDGSDRMVISNTGNVGIGTTSPATALHIDSSGATALTLQRNSGASSNISIKYDGASQDYYTGVASVSEDFVIGTSADLNGNNLLRVTSAGNVGIGTTNPLHKVDITGNASTAYDATSDSGQSNHDATLQIFNSNTTDESFASLVFRNRNSNVGISRISSISKGSGTTDMSFVTEHSNTKSEKLRITSEGNVGIGTASPSDKLHVSTGTDTDSGNIAFTIGGTSASNARTASITKNTSTPYELTIQAGNHATSNMETVFKSSDSKETMRIDSSGNLLVGKTATGFGTAGIELFHDNQVYATSTTHGLAVNRLSTDGALAKFYKDGSQAGSIGTIGGEIYIESGDVGLQFDASGNDIIPYGGGFKDATIDLGSSANRFKDIYRSGSTYSTSDRNKKQDIRNLTDAEARVATVAKGSLKAFRYIDSVEAEGDEANIHFGIIAQDLKAAFEAEGLNANDYQVFKTSTYTDDDGVEQTTYSICYENLLAFIIAAI